VHKKSKSRLATGTRKKVIFIITTTQKYFNIFKELKARITYEDLNSLMGWKEKRRGNHIWIHSPFNPNDKNPSLCQTPGRGWFDFSTNRSGTDPTSLYAEVKGIKMIEAAKELAALFNLQVADCNPFDIQDQISKQQVNKGFQVWKETALRRLCTLYRAIEDHGPVDGLADIYDKVDYWSHVLIYGSDKDCLELFREIGAWGMP